MYFFYLVVPDVDMVDPAHPAGVDDTADDLLSSPGHKMEFGLSPAILGTSARSGMVTGDSMPNSDVLVVGAGDGGAPGSVAAITLRQQVRSYSDSQPGASAHSIPHGATAEFDAAATGTFALVPPTMSYRPPPARVEGECVDGIYAPGPTGSALMGPTMQKRITLGGTYIRLSTASVPTGRTFRSGATVPAIPDADDEGIAVDAVFMFELCE